MGKVVFRHCQQAAGVLVDAVDDAGPQLAVDAGEVVAQGVQQAIDQGVILMPCRRMHHQALGLVDYQKILVLVDDVQLHFGGGDVHGLGFGDGKGDHVAHIQFVVFLAGLAVALHPALFNEPLGGTAGHVFRPPCQERVQTLPSHIRDQFHSKPQVLVCRSDFYHS